MTQQIISQGNPPIVWSTIDEAFQKINANFTELYLSIGGSGVELTNLPSSLVPDLDLTRDLGSVNKRWKDLYLGGESLYLGNALITADISGAVNLPPGSRVGGDLIKDPSSVGFGQISAPGQSVVTADSSSGNLNLFGNGISITTDPITDTVTFTNSGVTSILSSTGISVSSLSGAVTISNSGVTAAIGGSGIGVSSLNGSVTFTNTGIVNLTTDPGSGISLTSTSPGIINITNSAPNIIQPVHRFIAVDGQPTIDAPGPNGTLRFSSLTGIELTTNTVSNTITIGLSERLDIKGSIFADDSTMLVDSVNGRIVAPVFANVTGNVLGNLTGNVLGNLTGDVVGNLTGIVVGTLIGNVNGSVNGNIQGDLFGSVFADDSTTLVDSTDGKIVGPISSSDGVNSVIMDSVQGLLLTSTALVEIQGATGAQIGIGIGTSGDLYLGSGSNDIIISAGTDLLISVDDFILSGGDPGQILSTDGEGGLSWIDPPSGSGGGGGGGDFDFSIGADDSTLRKINSGESIKFIGSNGITTASDAEGNITISAAGVSGLASRTSPSGSTGNIADAATANVTITGFKSYLLYEIQTSAAAWVRIYTSVAARTADSSRSEGVDPSPGAGVIAEVITTGAETVLISPGTIGFNKESPVTTNIELAVTNKSGGAADITVTITIVKLEEEGGGGSGSSSALLVPEDSEDQTYILDAPSAAGQIYTVVIPFSYSSGNVTFEVAAIPGADLVVFVGGITGFQNYNSGNNEEVTEINSWTISRYNASAFKIDFVYQGLLDVEGDNYAIFLVHGMGWLNTG